MQDICIYCDILYSGNRLGLPKHLCLNYLEHITEKSMYRDINPLKDFDIKYDKNKVQCETCNKSHSLFIDCFICPNHKGILVKNCKYCYDYYYDQPEDYYDDENYNQIFDEIKEEIAQMLKYSKLTYKIYQIKDNNSDFEHAQFIFIYKNDSIVCKFIHEYAGLALILNNKIYTTLTFTDRFRDMYFNLNYEFNEINEILNVFKNYFNIKYNLMKDFDKYIAPENLIVALMNRFDILNDALVKHQQDGCICDNCDSYNHMFRITYNSIEILRIIYNEATLSVWTQTSTYSNDKNYCIHFNSESIKSYNYSNLEITKYINFKSNVEYMSLIEIYKLMINYTDRFREKKLWSDIVKCNK